MKLRQSLIATLLILAFGASTLVRADLYWDSNGVGDGGSDTDTATGTWGTDAFWGGVNGDVATGTWTTDETAVFSAAADVTGTNTVTVSGTQQASGIRVEEGTVTLSGGTVDLTNAATVTVGTGLTSTINSVIGGAVGLTQAGNGTLILNGANTYSGNTRLASNTVPSTFNTMRLGASERIPDASIIQVLGLNSTFELNTFTETVKSISGGGAGSRLDVGTGTLILDDEVGEVSSFASQIITSSTGMIIKNGAGQININASSGSWHGEFVLNDGFLGLGVANSLGTTASGTARLTINGGTIINGATAKSIQTQNVDITNDFSANMGGSNFQFIGLGGGDFTGDEGTAVITLKKPGVNSDTTIFVDNSNSTAPFGTFIFTGPVGDEGMNRSITKTGPGALTLNSKFNTYGGDTTIQAGQVRVDSNATLGDGTGTLNLAGGGLLTTRGRDPVTAPIPNAINMTADAVISTSRAQEEATVNLNFTTSSLVATAGTITFRNDAAAGGVQTTNQFEPQFSGTFTFGRPIVIAAGLNSALRTTRFNSTNASGTQTYNGAISGPGKFRRMVAGGNTVLTADNSYSGGTDVEGGTLTVTGSSADLGDGNVTVTGGALTISSGVANAIGDLATLSISGTGVVNLLGTGYDDLIAALSLGGSPLTTPGTYGSTASGADFPNDTFFTGPGVVSLASTAVDDADFDDDGDQDGNDFLIWQRGLTDNEDGTNATGDANDDTNVDGDDLAIWESDFGSATPNINAVPEPASLALAMLAAGSVFLGSKGFRRRGKR